jgi:hypothetical protein
VRANALERIVMAARTQIGVLGLRASGQEEIIRADRGELKWGGPRS